MITPCIVIIPSDSKGFPDTVTSKEVERAGMTKDIGYASKAAPVVLSFILCISNGKAAGLLSSTLTWLISFCTQFIMAADSFPIVGGLYMNSGLSLEISASLATGNKCEFKGSGVNFFTRGIPDMSSCRD